MSRSPVPPPPHAAAAQQAGQPTSNASHQATASVAPSVRAQLLTTEHWSLLATRSTTQSEVLSRITTYNHLQGAKPVLQPLASSGMFIAFVNSALTGVRRPRRGSTRRTWPPGRHGSSRLWPVLSCP
jgi:hypothetical protein